MTNPQPPVPPAPPARRTGTWQLVVGIIVAVIGVPNLLRGVSGFAMTLMQPTMAGPGYHLGIAFSGLLFIGAGVWLIIWSVRIRAANGRAVAAPYVPSPPATQFPATQPPPPTTPPVG